jgi:hypothetical protein
MQHFASKYGHFRSEQYNSTVLQTRGALVYIPVPNTLAYTRINPEHKITRININPYPANVENKVSSY